MNIFKNPKAKIPIRIGSIILSILELLIIFSVFPKYRGVLSYSFFTTLIILQPLWYFNLTKNNPNAKKTRKLKYAPWIIIIISILIPISINAALPQYTYNQGKDILENHLNQPNSIRFIVDEAIPVYLPLDDYNQGFPKELFMVDRFYYYEIEIDNNIRYFAIDPMYGQIIELENSFYH